MLCVFLPIDTVVGTEKGSGEERFLSSFPWFKLEGFLNVTIDGHKANPLVFVPVSVRFQPIGSAPILRQRVFKISASSRFSVVLNFLRKKIGVKDGDGLFLYVNSVFAPGLDEGVGNLFRVRSHFSICP